MGLLTPSGGLLFWMTLAFAVVFLILAKFAFPIILGSVTKRKEFIDSSLDAAKVAEQKVADLQLQSEQIIADAEKEKVAILKEAATSRDRIVADASVQAQQEASRIIAEGRRQAEAEKEAILANARGEVAMLAVQMATKILRGNLSASEAQQALQENLADEIRES
ncbi:MAG: F0F1 ATP synthase subunit B [Bacteroidales bacterium]|nr:F0F1 ATP synthase subunit B [Candidatus Equibacterium intestinale]